MTECTAVLLAFPKFDRIALDRVAELAGRDVDVTALKHSVALSREFHQGIADGTVLDMVVGIVTRAAADHPE